MENLKIKTYSNGVSKLPDYPSDEGYTAEMLKAVFDSRSDKEIKEKHNGLIDKLKELFADVEKDIATNVSATKGVGEELTEHKTSGSAHSDIRAIITELSVRLNTVADSDDVTLDQLSEIISYIKDNREIIEVIMQNKANADDVYDRETVDAFLEGKVGEDELKSELEGYVKNTDCATRDKAGVVKVSNAPVADYSGIHIDENGLLNVFEALPGDFGGPYPAVITIRNIDYAVQSVTNQEWKEEYTEEEKKLPMSTGVLFEKIGDLSTGANLHNGEGQLSLEQEAWSEASKNTAAGTGAVALGGYNKANAKTSMAVNYNNEVNAQHGFAANSANKIPEGCEASFVAGHCNEAKGEYQAVFGTYANPTSHDAFVIGNGDAVNGKKNAFKVDKSGNVEASGSIKATDFESKTLKAEDSVSTKSVVAQQKSYIGCGVVTEKDANFAQNVVEGVGAAAFGGSNKVYGNASFVAITSNTIPENLTHVFIAGHANTAVASHQAIFGTYALPETNDAFVIGNGTSTGKKNAFAVSKNGNIRIGGTQITLGNTAITETIIKKLWEIDALKEKIAALETQLSGESE